MIYSIRLKRKSLGRKKRPYFHIVVQYKIKGIQSAPLAIVGSYDIFYKSSIIKKKPKNVKNAFHVLRLNKSLLDYWIGKGAIPNEKIIKLLF